MNTFDKYLLKNDKLLRRRIEIDNSLYQQLQALTKTYYDTSINKLVNIAIVELINSKNVELYERPDNEIVEAHNFAILESSYLELEKLKSKYGISIYKLVNIAIYNVLQL